MDTMDSFKTGEIVAYLPLLKMVFYLLFMGLSWWGLQEVRFDVFLRRPKSRAAKLLQIFISIALGYLVGNFFIDYMLNAIQFGFFR